MVRESTRKAIAKYDKEHCVVITIKLNKKTDADILAAFEGIDNRQGFIKQAIREKIAKSAPVSDSLADEIIRTCF